MPGNSFCNGLYIQPSCQFEGLELKGEVKATGKIENDRDDEDDSSDEETQDDGSIGGTIKGNFTYQAIDKQPKKELSKIYFKTQS